jgi:hypothetical protein
LEILEINILNENEKIAVEKKFSGLGLKYALDRIMA